MRFLHLEDCSLDAELLGSVLRREWPQCRISRVTSRRDYESALQERDFDLILSDYSLPEFDGLSALHLAKVAAPGKPFIFVSGTIGEERAVEALRHGADDYIIKDRPQRILQAIRHALSRVRETERQERDDQRLREQAALLDHTRDAICVLETGLRISYWNASAQRVFGWSRVEAVGQQIDAFLFPHAAGTGADACRLALAQGEYSTELRPRPKDGRLLIVDSSWTRVSSTEAGSPKVMIIMTDMTERRRLEAELLRAQRINSIGMFSGAIAHDLNNLLTPMLMGIGLLRSHVRSESALHTLASMETSAEHGASLVRQLLSFARGADGARVQVDLAQAMKPLTRLLRQSLPPRIELDVQLAPALWPVHADVTQLCQVLLNLCINSRDAIPDQGRVTIAVRNVSLGKIDAAPEFDAKPGRYLQISVQDTGSGVPLELQQSIFTPFFTTKPVGQGTGLGLSSSVAIVKSHHGFITLESSRGTGATFHVFFPAFEPGAPVLS